MSDAIEADAVAVSALAAAWPILSAGLREMHVYHECDDFRECSILFGGMCAKTDHCSHCRYAMPCPTMQEILDIDKELGLTDE